MDRFDVQKNDNINFHKKWFVLILTEIAVQLRVH